MSANNPPQICIKLLRDIKTDALLIYIKTVIEELLENIKNEKYKIDLGFEEFNKETASFLLISSPLSHNFLKISALSIISPSLSEFYCI